MKRIGRILCSRPSRCIIAVGTLALIYAASGPAAAFIAAVCGCCLYRVEAAATEQDNKNKSNQSKKTES